MRNSELTIAATSTFAMVCAAEGAGVDATDLLHQHGLTRASIEDPDARIPARAVLAIWDALRERTRNATLQLIAPTSLPFGAYRIIDYIVAASATVGEGVERFARFFKLIAQVSLTIETDDGAYCLVLAMAEARQFPPCTWIMCSPHSPAGSACESNGTCVCTASNCAGGSRIR